MKLLHTIVDGETVVVDLTTGTILGTNLMAAPWPESQEEQESLLADASYAAFYAQQNGVSLLTSGDPLGHLEEARQALICANKARKGKEWVDLRHECDYLRDTVNILSTLLAEAGLELFVEKD